VRCGSVCVDTCTDCQLGLVTSVFMTVGEPCNWLQHIYSNWPVLYVVGYSRNLWRCCL